MDLGTVVREYELQAKAVGVEETATAARKLGQATDAGAVAVERMNRVQASAASALERFAERMDRAYKAQKEFERAQDLLTRAQAQGLASTTAYQRAVEALAERQARLSGATNDNVQTMGRFQRATGLAGHQVTNLGYQLNDVAVSLASGQSPFTVLVQQGSQILPILSSAPGGVGGALAGIGRYLVGLVTPASVAGAALVAVGATAVIGIMRYNEQVDALEKSLQGLGRSTTATVGALLRLADAGAAQGNITVSAARAAAGELASTGKIGISNFEGLIAVSKRFADTLGVDATEGNKKLAESFADPAKGADELNQKLNFLDDKTREYIRQLAAQNDQTAAQRALLDALGPSLVDSANKTSALGRAWEYVKGAASGAAAAIAQALAGPGPEKRLVEMRQYVQDISSGLMARTPVGQQRIEEAKNKLMEMEEQYRRNGAAAAAASKAMSDEAAANRASVQAGEITRALDPLNAKYQELIQKQATLKQALETPAKLADPDAARQAYEAYGRAVETLTGANGKLISSQDLLRQKDQLALDAINAQTDAEKKSVAERQKALDLVGEVVTKEEAARRVAQAGNVAAAQAAKTASSANSDAASAYDNLIQRTKDRIEELQLEAQYASKTATEVIKLKLAHDLERAAKKDGTEVTEAMRKEWDALGNSLAAATQNLERVRREQDQLRQAQDFVADSFKSFVEDLVGGSGKLQDAFKSLGKNFLSSSLDALINGKGALAGTAGLSSSDRNSQGGLLGLLSGSNLQMFQKAIEKGTERGSASGFEGGFAKIASNDNFSLLGGIDGKQLAGGLTAITSLAGAYGTGMSAGSFGQAVGGGAISGLVGGLGLASAGLGSAAVLGPIGLIAGGALAYYGQQQKRKQEREAREKEAQANYKEAQPQIASLGSQFRGEAQNTLAQRLADAEASARKLGDAAFFAGKKSEQDKVYADFVGFRDRTLKEFRDSFGGTIQAINDGLGSDSPFGRSRDAVKAMGETLKTFIADAGTAFGNAAPEVARARESARSYALMVLDGVREMSATATRLQEIKGAATGLQQVLVDLGMAAGDAAVAIDQKTRAAIERLRASFESDLSSKIDDAAGRGYLNDLSSLLKEVSTLRTDAASIGADPALVTSYLQAKAQEIVNRAGLTGKAFEQLLIRFPDLIGVVREAGVVFDDTARAVEAASRKLTYQDRLFSALNDTTSLAGQLAAFDRSAERERAAEIKAGGDAINELEATLAAERLKIITDFATQAAEEQKRALEEAQNFFDSFSRNLREFVDGLKTNASSPLSPQARLAEAQAQYDRQIALARTGDRDAVNNLTSYASSFIEAAKAFYASSSGFQQVFNQITSDLTALPTQVSAEQFIVDAIKDSRDKLIASIDLNGDGMISLQEATNAGLGSIFSTLDSNGDGQISLLELIRGATTSTSQSTDYGNVLIAQMQGIQNYSNTLQGTANYIASTQASLLDQIRSLNDSSRSTLDALLGQFSLNASLGINGIGLNNNMVTALNKIVYNTAGIWSATVKGPAPAAYAEGGWIRGPGTGTSDSLIARVSNGEFVVNAADAARNRELLETINGGGDLFSGLMVTGFGEAPRPMAMAPANSNEDSGAIVTELRRLYGRIDRLEAQLVAAEYGAAERVSASVDVVAKETSAARSDARMQRADPRRRSA